MPLVLSGSVDISGSMTATTILVSSPGGGGMVSSSQQIQNYNLFAVTSSANTFYGNQTINGDLNANIGGFSNYISLGGTSGLNTYGTINVPTGERMILNSYHGLELKTSGGVGSGTPISILKVDAGGKAEITGSVNITGALNGTSATFNHNDAPTIRIQRNGGTDANTVLEFTNSSRSFFIGSNGTVMGIGGTSGAIGSQPLQITSTGAATFSNSVTSSGLYVGGALTSAADAATITLKQTSTTAATGIYLERSGEQKGYYMYLGGSNDSLLFRRNNAGTKSDVMALTRDGKIGMGASTNPTYILEASTAGGSERIRVGTLQNNNNTATFEAITTSDNTTATSGWIRALYGGGLAIGTSTYGKTGGDSGNFANLSSEAASTAITVNGGDVQLNGSLFNTSNVISIPNSATTIFTSTGFGGVWFVSYVVSGNPSQVGYAIVGNAFGSTLTVLASAAGSQTALSVSGLNLQLSQSAGGSINTRVNVIKLNTTYA